HFRIFPIFYQLTTSPPWAAEVEVKQTSCYMRDGRGEIAWFAEEASAMSEKRRLGRGLDALLGGAAPTESNAAARATEVPIGQIAINPSQPRKEFDEEDMASLKSSLATHGLLNPVLVRPAEGGYQLIAGERRLRAAKEVGWKNIPVTIVDFD